MIALSSNLGNFNVIDGDLSRMGARLALRTGLCGDLAYAIHKKTNLPPVFVFYEEFTPEELQERFEDNPKYIFNSQHVMIKSSHGDGFIDSCGYKTFDEIDEHYEGVSIIEGTPEMIEYYAANGISSKLSNFADTAIKLDSEKDGYDYDEMDDWGDDSEDDS